MSKLKLIMTMTCTPIIQDMLQPHFLPLFGFLEICEIVSSIFGRFLFSEYILSKCLKPVCSPYFGFKVWMTWKKKN